MCAAAGGARKTASHARALSFPFALPAMHAAPALALLAALALVAAQPLPGDSVPAAVRIPLYSASGKPQTLDLSASKPPKQALIVQLYDSASYFVQAMWADPSLPTFLSWLATNDDVTLLVLPTAADAPAPIYNALKAAVDSLTISSSAKKAALSRVLVGQSISNATAAWIGQVAATWPNTRLYINVTSGARSGARAYTQTHTHPRIHTHSRTYPHTRALMHPQRTHRHIHLPQTYTYHTEHTRRLPAASGQTRLRRAPLYSASTRRTGGCRRY